MLKHASSARSVRMIGYSSDRDFGTKASAYPGIKARIAGRHTKLLEEGV
jgi:hypothetical protein